MSSSLTPEELRAAAETHSELGPDYQSAVIESFIENVGREIDARVDARLASHQVAPQPQGFQPGQPYQPYQPGQPLQPIQPGQRPAKFYRERSPFALAVVSMAIGIPLTAIITSAGTQPGVGFSGLVVVWVAIAIINVAYTLGHRSSGQR